MGACSVWLHLDVEEEKQKVPPALQDLCERLLGVAVCRWFPVKIVRISNAIFGCDRGTAEG